MAKRKAPALDAITDQAFGNINKTPHPPIKVNWLEPENPAPPPSAAEIFDINTLDVSDPKQVYDFKNHIVRESYRSAMSGSTEGSKTVTALKNLMEILVEAEKQYNVIRHEQLLELEESINALETEIDRLASENADLKAKYVRKD